jgi:hypothetical protein
VSYLGRLQVRDEIDTAARRSVELQVNNKIMDMCEVPVPVPLVG